MALSRSENIIKHGAMRKSSAEEMTLGDEKPWAKGRAVIISAAQQLKAASGF